MFARPDHLCCGDRPPPGTESGGSAGGVRSERRAASGRWAAARPCFRWPCCSRLQLLDQATQSAFNVLIPNVRDAFHLSDAEILTIVALAGAAALLGTVPVAWLADRTVHGSASP